VKILLCFRRSLALPLAISVALLVAGAANAQVRREWAATYNDPENGHDEAAAMVTDGDGNAFVVGIVRPRTATSDNEYVVLKFGAGGGLAWERRVDSAIASPAPMLELDGQSNLLLAGSRWGGSPMDGGTAADYLLVKYSPEGDLLWSRAHDIAHASGADMVYALAVDATGNVYITGRSWPGQSTQADFATLKIDPADEVVWERRFDAASVHGDGAFDIEVDPAGRIYVIGHDGLMTYILLRYDGNGDIAWERRLTGTIFSDLEVPRIEIDGRGDVIINGTAENVCGELISTTSKYDSDGQLQWQHDYPQQAPCGPGRAAGMALDADGNVVVVGFTTALDYEVIKYDGSGDLVWARQHDGPAFVDKFGTLRSPFDTPRAVATDAMGNVYLTGFSEIQALTMKYDPSGVLMWAAAFDGSLQSLVSPAAISWSPDGGICLAGSRLGESGSTDLVVWKYIPTATVHFSRGDATGDGALNLSDAVSSLMYLFAGASPGPCLRAADTNDDGIVDISDPVSTLGFLFLGTPGPPPPFPACGTDPTDDPLTCSGHRPCWDEL